MIHGAEYWSDKDKYYIQSNNPTEEMLKKQGLSGFLESCGPTSAVGCLAVHDYDVEIVCPGPYRPQPDEVLTDWFNDPRNYSLLERVRSDIGPRDLPGNRVPQYYPPAVLAVFGIQCEFVWVATHHQLADYFRAGCSVQLCLRKPSHYVAGVAYDEETSEIIYNDPWPGRFKDGKGGFNRRFSNMANLNEWAVVYP